MAAGTEEERCWEAAENWFLPSWEETHEDKSLPSPLYVMTVVV